MKTQQQMFLLNLTVTIIYYILHLFVSKFYQLSHQGIQLHLLTLLALIFYGHLNFDQIDISDLITKCVQNGYITLVLTLSWFILFKIVDFLVIIKDGVHIRKTKQIKIRCVAIFHGLIASIGCFYLLANYDFDGNEKTVRNDNYKQLLTKFMYQFSLSYFIYHLFLCFQIRYKGKGMLYHHLISIFGISYFLYLNSDNYYGLSGIFVGQFTNPFMHIKAITNKLGFYHTKLSVILEKVYIYLYIFMRTVIFIPFCLITCLLDPKLGIVVKLIHIAFMVFNIFIINSMVGLIKNRKIRQKQMQDKQIFYEWFTVNRSKLQTLSFYKQKTDEDQ